MGYRVVLFGLVILLTGCVSDQRRPPAAPPRSDTESFGGQAVPELVSAPRHWLNARGERTLEGLRGKVVWLQFNF